MQGRKLKIGFAGNTNNYPYTLALAFDKLGHDVKFLVDSSYNLHRPEFRFQGAPKNTIRLLDISPVNFGYWQNTQVEKIEEMKAFFKDRDILILNSDFVSLYGHINKPHIVLLTGSDLDFLASEKYIAEFKVQLLSTQEKWINRPLFSVLNALSYLTPSVSDKDKFFYSKNRFKKYLGITFLIKSVRLQKSRQANGIRQSPFIVGFPKGLNKSGELVLNNIGASGKKRIFNLMTDVNSVRYAPAPDNRGTVRIFNVARFNWYKNTAPEAFTEMDFKGNDVMIKGIALFVKQHPECPIKLVFVRKGANLSETYQLIDELKIGHLVEWKDELSQSQVLEEYEKADIIFDQFTTSIVGMGGLDALAVGRPLIANWRPEFFEQYVGQWPVCQATNPQEVCEQLKLLILNPTKRLEIGKAGRAFVEEKLSSEAFAERILNAIVQEQVVKN